MHDCMRYPRFMLLFLSTPCAQEGWTALLLAIVNDNLEVVQVLLAAGADIEAATPVGGWAGGSWVWESAAAGSGMYTRDVEVLIWMLAPWAQDGVTPLMMASKEGLFDEVQALIDAGAYKEAKETKVSGVCAWMMGWSLGPIVCILELMMVIKHCCWCRFHRVARRPS